jgi:hypothetical protein
MLRRGLTPIRDQVATSAPTRIVCGDDDHRRKLAAEGRGEHWQQLCQGSARTDDQILIYRSRWSGTASCAGAAFKAESTFDEPSLTSLALRLSTRPPIVI